MTSPTRYSSMMNKDLFKNAMGGQWDNVVQTYKTNSTAYEAKITRSGDTALHIAVNDAQEQTVQKLVDIMSSNSVYGINKGLKVTNERGDTPLHLAASLGNVKMSDCIARKDPSLLGARNNDNETPFFLAARHGKREAFLCLYRICGHDKGKEYYRGKDGETILHVAISGEYFDLALQIIHFYGELVNYFDQHGISPLHLLASQPTAFRSGSHLGGYKKIIYNCTFVDEIKVLEQSDIDQQPSSTDKQESPPVNYPQNYETCCSFFLLLKAAVQLVMKRDKDSKRGDSENQQGEQSSFRTQRHQLLPSNYQTCFEFVKFMSKAMLVVLGLGSSEITKLEDKKKKHKRSVQIMNELLRHATMNEYEYDGRSPLLSPSEAEESQPCAFGESGNVTYSEIMEQVAQDSQSTKEDGEVGNSSLDKKNASKMETEKPKAPVEKKETPILIAANNGIREIMEKILEKFPVAIHDMNSKKNIVLLAVEKEETPTLTAETPILIAAKNGIREIVEKILEKFPVAIHDMNSEKKNIVLLAVENRQPHVYQYLLSLRGSIMKESIFRKVDSKGNSALHLAATLGDFKPWRIPGAALQMQWEIKWYEYVKNSMPRQFFVRHNKAGKTPKDIFTDTHQDLVKSGGEWLTNTSESCSVVAALIATVAFATSSTVPGGVNEGSGTPILENQPAFKVFAISSLVALCFSVTAVVMFLSILTSRYQEMDFGKDLPRKLLVGLTSLFVSIASILVSFCAGHFFVLRDELKYAAFPVYAVTCLPVTFFAVAQFPLYFDLVWATFKKVPQRSYMVVT